MNQSSNNTCLGVVGGDLSCIRSMIINWVGRPQKLYKEKTIFHLYKHDKYLLFVTSYNERLKIWPGSSLIWLFPERGPSQPELSQLNIFISNNKLRTQKLNILLCMPNDITSRESQFVLETTSETLYWNIDRDFDIHLEAVWLTKNHPNSLTNWLLRLQEKI